MTTTPTPPALDPFFANPAVFATIGVPHHRLSRHIRAGAYPVTPRALINLVAAEDQLETLAEKAAEPQETYYEFLTRISREAVADEPISPDVISKARDVINQAETARLDGMLIGQMRSNLESRWTEALREHVGSMLEGLRPELTQVVDAVAEAAANLAGLDLSDPEIVAAATAEQHTALSVMAALRSRYKHLRAMQRQLVESTADNPKSVDVPSNNWRSVFDSEVTSYSKIPALGVPSREVHQSQWWTRLIGRDDVWIPTLPELAAAIGRGTTQQIDDVERTSAWR